MQIKNIGNLSVSELQEEVLAGGKFVTYQYCVSFIFFTFRPPTSVYFIPEGKSAVLTSLPFTLITLLFGWWGIPWGPVHTIGALVHNYKGGQDVTAFITEILLTQQPIAKHEYITYLSTFAA